MTGRLANPEQIVAGLLIQRDAGPDTGMDEEPLSVVVVSRQVVDPGEVIGREVFGRGDAVRSQCGAAVVGEPAADRVMGREASEEEILVIAGQGDDPVGIGHLHVHDR